MTIAKSHRLLNIWQGEVKTHFLKLVSPEGCDAKSITESINCVIKEAQLDWNKCVMFTSDGAEVMMGRYNGVQARIKVNH